MNMRAAQLAVGLTGGIGCGKSTAAELFAKHGAGVVDTDVIAHLLTQSGGDGIAAIRAAFGGEFITADGALDRARMRSLIFSDAAAKQRLEHILHPLILEQARMQLARLQTRPYIILVVPLLAESPGFRKLVRRMLVVDCDEATQVARVTGRSGLGGEEVRAIIAQQASRAERLRLADDVIHNDAGVDRLAEQVAVLHRKYSTMQNSN
jgi:dephospho-CoA kinase